MHSTRRLSDNALARLGEALRDKAAAAAALRAGAFDDGGAGRDDVRRRALNLARTAPAFANVSFKRSTPARSNAARTSSDGARPRRERLDDARPQVDDALFLDAAASKRAVDAAAAWDDDAPVHRAKLAAHEAVGRELAKIPGSSAAARERGDGGRFQLERRRRRLLPRTRTTRRARPAQASWPRRCR